MHGHRSQIPASADPVAARIAQLSAEYLDADAARKSEISAEIQSLMNGQIIPFK